MNELAGYQQLYAFCAQIPDWRSDLGKRHQLTEVIFLIVFGLRPVERAVLWRLLEQGPRFRPYDAEALRCYVEKSGERVSTAKA